MLNLSYVRGFESFSKYVVSDKGEIFSLKFSLLKARKLKPYKSGNGYLKVKLTDDNGNVKQLYVHRLVALAYIDGNSKKRNQVNHKNFDKSDNTVNNLEWVSNTENIKHYNENLYKFYNMKNNYNKGVK